MDATGSVSAALADARQQLLDLGLRNTLINYRLLKSRGIELINVDPGEVFRLLVVEGKAISFVPKPEEPDTPPIAQTHPALRVEASSSKRPQRGEFETDHTSKDLEKRLLNSFYLARTSIEEQGVSTLYVAIGMLHWYEAPSTNDVRRAPIILIPVRLERASSGSAFQVVYSGEDLGENLSLKEKLQTEFGITPPPLPELEDLDLATHFGDWSQAIARQPRWNVDARKVVLGFFSFGKFLMYRDLDPQVWPGDRRPQNHPIVGKLLGEGFVDSAPSFPDDQLIDSISEAFALHQVVDADSSQTLAILEAAAERNLVIQGPPGTGKSQTITNILAEAIATNKTVLFVSEKMAALEVVKRNLDQIGIGDACLELHSNKANKRDLLNELKRTLQLSRPRARNTEQREEQLKQSQQRLNAYCDAVNQQIGVSGVSPMQAYGYLLRLSAKLPAGTHYPEIGIAEIADWTANDIDAKAAIVARLERQISEMGPPKEHPFYGLAGSSIQFAMQSRIASSLDTVLSSYQRLTTARDQLAELMHFPVPTTLEGCRSLAKNGRAIEDAPTDRPAGFATQDWHENKDMVLDLLKTGSSYADIRAKWSDTLQASAWDDDLGALLETLEQFEHRWWRGLSGQYRGARRQLRSLCVSDGPAAVTDQVSMVRDIVASQAKAKRIKAQGDTSRSYFGQEWKGVTSDWEALHKQAEWASSIHTAIHDQSLSGEVLNALSSGVSVEGQPNALEAAIIVYEQSLEQLLTLLEFDPERTGWTTSQLLAKPLTEQFEHVSKWSNRRDDMTQVLSLNAMIDECQQHGIGAIAEVATNWDLAGEHLVGAFENARYIALIDRAYGQRPPLGTFSLAGHEYSLDTFKKSDSALFAVRRLQVAESHWRRIPRHDGGGQLAKLRHEFEKKSRHKPIRQLIFNSGNAIQAIKPIFMMSPMSIATFLPPESVTFDLVIFDEASQVSPPDALGALLRGEHAIVVGDSKQLPPTQFFNAVAQGDDESDEWSPTRDLESVLGLFVSKNVQQKMLRWHYRSRHESLIAVSNQEFYDNRLLVFPSPFTDREQIGLKFHHLPHAVYDRGGSTVNRIEAETVAKAVLEHARQNRRTGSPSSLGVATFSARQAEAIRDELERLRADNPELKEFLDTDEIEPFFVKNLENVQGDERDVIFISVGYGPDSNGRLNMNFGPLNNDGGERRLNVLITRARRRCEIFSSITADDIDLGRSRATGVKAFKQYLKYAETGRLDDLPEVTGREVGSPFENAARTALVDAGYEVHAQVGHAGFFIDLAIVDTDNPGRYLLGIECDGATYHSARSARDRDRLRQLVLEGLGWTIHRIWSTAWFQNPSKELNRVIRAVEDAQARKEQLPEVTKTQQPASAKLPREEVVPANHEEKPSMPYKLASITLPNTGADLHEMPIPVMAEAIAVIARTESPVHIDEVSRRIMAAANVSRLGNRIRAQMKRAALHAQRNGLIAMRDKFIWDPAMTDPPIRDRSVQSTSLRSISSIAPEEIAAAVRQVVAESFGIDHDEAIQRVGSLFGYQRVTAPTREAIAKSIQQLIRTGVLHDDRQFLSLR